MAGPSETYTRRVSAVLLADVTSFSALMALDDEGTTRAVRRAQELVQEIVGACEGQAQPVAGDSILASFQNIVAAVDAALRIQQRLAAEDFAGRRLQMRIGVHFGDVLLAAEGLAFGDAVNVAARLMALARPGTICISSGVHRLVRTKFDEHFEDLGRQRLKNISDPVHAYLIVPTGIARRRRAPRRATLAWFAGVTALGLMAVAVVAIRRESTTGRGIGSVAGIMPSTPAATTAAPAATAPRVTLGVMLFKSPRDDPEHGWMREALRDGLNTQLSELSHVKVYSREFLDFLITRQGLSEIEAATKLGIKTMLSGSIVALNGTLRIETHVVDVASGVLEASYSTVGPEQDFLDLQNKMVLSVIAKLNLPLTPDDEKRLAARKTTDVDALKLLLEAEGSTVSPPPQPRPPGSALERWFARRVVPRSVFADDEAAVRAAIMSILERYREATEARALADLAALYTELSAEQQAAQQRYFDNVKDLKVAIDNVDVAVVGDEAVVSYTRTDDFADARTGRPMHVSLRLTKRLRRQDGAWRIAAGK